jgi:DNA-binding response OmpR family regulator
MRRLLEEDGYWVLEATDCVKAMALHELHGGRIDLLLTALALPDNNGYELARALFLDNVSLKALFVSARAGCEVSRYYHMPITGRHLLSKPLCADQLRDRVRSIFGRTPRRFPGLAASAGSKTEV